MTAASAPVVQIQRLRYAQSSKVSATANPNRVATYLLEVQKVTQNDWIITATALPSGNADTIFNVSGVTIDSSQNAVQETFTYTHTGDKLTLTSSTVGTTWIEITVKE